MADSTEYGALYIMKTIRGGLVTKAESALKLAEILIADANDAAYLESERPLTVTEQADRWVVAGRADDDDEVTGRRPVSISIAKNDAKILDFKIQALTLPHSVVSKIFKGPVRTD